MTNRLESRLHLINNGFPRIDSIGVDHYFRGVIDSLEGDRQAVNREIPKTQKSLRKDIQADIFEALGHLRQYNAEERAFTSI